MTERCERARRDDGLPARLNCDICGRGPCGKAKPEPVRSFRHLAQRIKADMRLDPYGGQIRVYERPDGERVVHPLWAQAVPNRLYGATVNHEGDAV